MSRHQALDTFGRSGNPVMGNKFDGDAQFRDMPISQKMTLEGTVNKTGILLMPVSYTHLTLPTNREV